MQAWGLGIGVGRETSHVCPSQLRIGNHPYLRKVASLLFSLREPRLWASMWFLAAVQTMDLCMATDINTDPWLWWEHRPRQGHHIAAWAWTSPWCQVAGQATYISMALCSCTAMAFSGNMALGHQHGLRPQHREGTTTQPLIRTWAMNINTDPGFHRTIDPVAA